MGVDSGLPDFRGDQGFWKAYPPYERLGLTFVEAANPEHFDRDPAFGWGFYGHRTNLYRATVPHRGFFLLREWAERFAQDVFVVTSNVDGQFQKAGFREDQILEVHGSIHHLQCLAPCRHAIWDNREEIPVDETTMRARHIPRCPHCGGVARPNILMFGDFGWDASRAAVQERALQLAAGSDRPANAKGVALVPLKRTIEADALRYEHVTVTMDRAARTATFTVKAPHGAQRNDEYYWLRDDSRKNPEMLAYLEADQ